MPPLPGGLLWLAVLDNAERTMLSLHGGLLWLAIIGLSRAQHEVTIEEGPLYRTVGSHATIWCKVSGNGGAPNQEFEFSVRLPSDPEKEIKVVSTGDPNFSYSAYTGRVRSRDVSIEKVSRGHTVLHIVNLQEKDTGEYECYTPNTASTYLGTYSARTNLTVIPNTLRVLMPLRAVETSEGASLDLTCQVSMASSQHTHLSVSWILSTDRESEILTLSRDFVLHPGGAFPERFTAGEVRMDKLSETTYRLTIGALRQSDQGQIFCRGSEWIQDPSGVWTKIAEKDSEKTTLKVAAVRGGDFGVQVEAPATVLTPGHPLEVTCSVTSPGGGQFRVVWLLGGTKMATWEPSGVVTFRKESGSAGAEGRLVVQRRDLTTWVLGISRVRIEDGGSYVCEVTEERSKKTQMSKPMSVEVKRPESRAPQVTLAAVTSQLYEGDWLGFRCLVSSSSSSSSASLGWFRKAASGDLTQIASILPDGRLVIGADYKSRHDGGHLVTEKGDSGLFILRLDDLTQSDKGEYVCRYTGGTQGEGGAWTDVTTDSNGVQIDVQHLNSALKVSLMTRDSKAILGHTATLYCNAKASFSLKGRRLAWSWFFQPDQRGPFQSLVGGSGNGELVWGESYPDFNGKTQISLNADKSVLRVHRVQRSRQSGAYQCRVTVLTNQSAATPATISSNTVSIHVQLPDMKLGLSSAPSALALTAGQDEAEVTCRILERTPDTKLSIVWFFRPPSSASSVEILRVDREGVTSQDPSPRPRFISGRSSADFFLLRILRPGLREVGSYHCTVQEWLLEETGNWTQLGEKKSGDTEITFIASDQTLRLRKQNVSSSVKQGEDLVLRCPLEAGLSPSSLLSVSWYLQRRDFRPPHLLYRTDQEGVTKYEDSRLRMVAPGRGDYRLVLQRAQPEDSGRYFCQVEEWRMQEGEWKTAASDQSGFLEISVTPPEDHLSLNLTDLTLVVAEQSTVTLPCQVLAVSMPSSHLSVSWWKAEGPGAPHMLLFGVNHTGVFLYPQEKRDRLQYERPSELTYHLRIHGGHMADRGTYYCRVREWLLSPRGVWEPIGERQSRNISVFIQTAGSSSPICTSPSLFHFLLLFTIFFIILVLALITLALCRCRGSGGQRRAPGGLWSSVKMSEMEKEDGGQT